MARERIQTRDDGDVKAAVEQYADDADVSEAEAVRRLVRAGLAVKGYDSPAAVSDEIEAWAEREGYSVAKMNPYVQLIGGALIGLAILALLLNAVL